MSTVAAPHEASTGPNAAVQQLTGRRQRKFTRLLMVILLGALGLRVGYVAFAKKGPCNIVAEGRVISSYRSECTGESAERPNDQLYYNVMANQIADGRGFVGAFGDHPEVADHPPMTSVVLASVSWLFDREPLVRFADETRLSNGVVSHTFVREQRYLMALIGTLNVLLIGLLGRRLGGDSAGLVAALFAALYPNLWVNDGLLFAETIAITTVIGSMLCALRCAKASGSGNYLLLGATIALAALTRAELLLLAPLLVIPLAARRRDGFVKATTRVTAAAVGCIVVMSPWFIYNQGRFEHFVMNSTNDGLALAGSYCDPVFYGDSIGLWATEDGCSYTPEREASIGDQSEVSTAYRAKAFEYFKNHKSRFPIVVAARVGRTFSLYAPRAMISYNKGENREPFVAWPGLIAYYLLLAPALIGVGALIRCRERLNAWILATPVITVTAVSVVTYGQTRFRATAEPSLVVCAALGIVWCADGVRRRRSVRNRAAQERSDTADELQVSPSAPQLGEV